MQELPPGRRHERRWIAVYGDGSQTRSFCRVDDMVDALILMMATVGEVTGPVKMGNPRG